ncbi:P-loop NTPase [Candidatus Bathyarchaeota archaeon A05DMB-2]|jgi:CO dehydrogenase maturation factor|nr:P-loop NTPase [Candidatus Bathyarchaeota archaeon A05DMB-2]
MKIAVSGKGGVGKTLIAGGLARGFAERGLKTIAIDADSSPNLALTLGLSTEEARKIVPISENKELVDSKTGTGYSGVYRLSFTVDDIVRDYSVSTPFGVNLIVMGTVKAMGSGCMCAPNAVIRALLRHLIVERNEAVVLDLEAGVEHIGRGTAKQVDALLIVADSNLKSLETAKHIHDLAAAAGMKQLYLVGNRVMNDAQKQAITAYAEKNDLSLLTFIPFDPKVTEADMRGETPLLNREIEAVQVIDGLCEKLIEKNS